MKVLDLCAGTGSATQAFVDRGHDVDTLDVVGGHTFNMDVRKFKRAEDIGEATDMMPELMERFQSKLAENPAKGMRWLASLKANNYQTMPAFGEDAQAFVDFYRYLVDTQGEEAAQDRLEDYMRQNAVNKAKASLVP